MAKLLSAYPRPKNDTGIGLHLSANAWDSRYYGKDASRDYDTWRQMGVTWLKVLAGGDSQLVPVTEFVKAGFEVIVRLYSNQPHPIYVPAADLMKQYADVGVHYIEGGNEPELNVEWAGENIPANAPMLLARQYRMFADDAARTGVIPVTYAMQGDRLETWFKAFILEMRNKGWLDAIEGSVIGIHNRPGRMPIDSPPIDATHGGVGFVFCSYEAWIPFLKAQLGWCPPLLGTEAGRELSEVNEDMYLHAADNVSIHQREWMPELFCQCHWLWCPGGMGNGVAWVDNANHVSPLPVVRAFINMPKRIRNAAPPDLSDEAITKIILSYPKLINADMGLALYRAGKEADLGDAMTDERHKQGWIFQRFQRGGVACKENDFGNVRVIRF